MENQEFPKLHLPPWFHDGWAELIKQKQWFGGCYIELVDGVFVRPTFITLDRIKHEMDSPRQNFYFENDLVIMREVSIDRIRELLPVLASSGVLSQMESYPTIQWEQID